MNMFRIKIERNFRAAEYLQKLIVMRFNHQKSFLAVDCCRGCSIFQAEYQGVNRPLPPVQALEEIGIREGRILVPCAHTEAADPEDDV